MCCNIQLIENINIGDNPMKTPQTINGLMRHLRNNCSINISGSYQKQQLISYGYYHGYKWYRFAKTSNNRIPYTHSFLPLKPDPACQVIHHRIEKSPSSSTYSNDFAEDCWEIPLPPSRREASGWL